MTVFNFHGPFCFRERKKERNQLHRDRLVIFLCGACSIQVMFKVWPHSKHLYVFVCYVVDEHALSWWSTLSFLADPVKLFSRFSLPVPTKPQSLCTHVIYCECAFVRGDALFFSSDSCQPAKKRRSRKKLGWTPFWALLLQVSCLFWKRVYLFVKFSVGDSGSQHACVERGFLAEVADIL